MNNTIFVKLIVGHYKVINEIGNLIVNIQFSVKQNKIVSGHFIWDACNNHLAQNSVVSPIPKGIFSFKTFCLVNVIKVIYCLLKFLEKFFHDINIISNKKKSTRN